MGRRRWMKINNSNKRKLVPVVEDSFSPERSRRVSVEEEKILAKAEEIRLRQSGFVVKSNQTKEIINAELLKDKVLYVDCQLDKSEQKNKSLSRQDITGGIVSQLKKLGATVSQSLTKKVNLIIFMNGRYSTYQFAEKKSIPLISSGWIEESKKLNKPAPTKNHTAIIPSNFLDPVAPRKYKRTYTLEHLEKLKEVGEKKKTKGSQKAKDEVKSDKVKDSSKKEEKKAVKEPKKTDKSSKQLATKISKISAKVLSKKISSKTASTGNCSHQENKSPGESNISRKRRSSSLEIVKVVSPVIKEKSSLPTKKAESPPKEVRTPIKRIRIESSCSPLATPPREPIPKTEQIAISNLNHEQYKILNEAVTKLGRFQVIRNAHEGATHVVWGSGRTINLLRGIAIGCRLMSFSWVEESIKKGKWLPEDDFIAPPYVEVDKEIQKRKKTLGRFFACQLLRSVGPMYVNSGVKSARPEDLRNLIKLCGGTLVQNIQDAVLVIGPPPDKLVFSTTAFVRENWIYSSITSYQVKPLKPFVYDSAGPNEKSPGSAE